MNNYDHHKTSILKNGHTTIKDVYNPEEIDQIITLITNINEENENFRKGNQLFAIRQFLKEIPSIVKPLINDTLTQIIQDIFGIDYFIIKSIYFDKPSESNWYVPYHQDLTISVKDRLETPNFGPWTVKKNQFSVQPTIELLENIFTIRIHLDDTDAQNGALKVINGSHLNKIYRPETINWDAEIETICDVPKGGIMIMKPLLLHSSSKSTHQKRRRVIHIELSDQSLPNGLVWSEKQNLN